MTAIEGFEAERGRSLAAVENVRHAHDQAFRAMNAEAVANVFAYGAEMMSPDSPFLLESREAIYVAHLSLFKRLASVEAWHSQTHIEVYPNGIATDRGNGCAQFTYADGRVVRSFTRYSAVLEERDGVWRVVLLHVSKSLFSN